MILRGSDVVKRSTRSVGAALGRGSAREVGRQDAGAVERRDFGHELRVIRLKHGWAWVSRFTTVTKGTSTGRAPPSAGTATPARPSRRSRRSAAARRTCRELRVAAFGDD